MSKTKEHIDQIFAEAGQLNPDNLGQFIEHTIQFFDHLQTKTTSENEEDKKESLEMAAYLQKRLEEHAKTMIHSLKEREMALEKTV
jgi:hypothetical protein